MKTALWILFLVMLGAAFYLLFTGPRMYVQPHLRAFQLREPALPAGVLTVQAAVPLPSAAAAPALANPLTATPENLARGKTYYGYYCAFCHGADGRGDGPVGQSYVPPPKTLVSARIRTFSDGQLLRAMLTGVGHEPVLTRVIPPEHRWYTVLYVRHLSEAQTSPAAPELASEPRHDR